MCQPYFNARATTRKQYAQSPCPRPLLLRCARLSPFRHLVNHLGPRRRTGTTRRCGWRGDVAFRILSAMIPRNTLLLGCATRDRPYQFSRSPAHFGQQTPVASPSRVAALPDRLHLRLQLLHLAHRVRHPARRADPFTGPVVTGRAPACDPFCVHGFWSSRRHPIRPDQLVVTVHKDPFRPYPRRRVSATHARSAHLAVTATRDCRARRPAGRNACTPGWHCAHTRVTARAHVPALQALDLPLPASALSSCWFLLLVLARRPTYAK